MTVTGKAQHACGQCGSKTSSRGIYCSNACRQKAYRRRNGQGRQIVTSAVVGKNHHLVAKVSRLYLRPGMVVADVTYGKGGFWKSTDTTIYDFRPSDITTGTDFRDLPYLDESLDVLVLDPPYHINPKGRTSIPDLLNSYNLHLREEPVLDLYRVGLREAQRVSRAMGWPG